MAHTVRQRMADRRYRPSWHWLWIIPVSGVVLILEAIVVLCAWAANVLADWVMDYA